MKFLNLKIIFIFALLLSSCVAINIVDLYKLINISRFDQQTYLNLVNLKPQVISLYKSFKYKKLNKQHILNVGLRIDQGYEYERGKQLNNLTIEQFRILRKMFYRHVNLRLKSKLPWNPLISKLFIKNISNSFDILITSERSKNSVF